MSLSIRCGCVSGAVLAYEIGVYNILVFDGLTSPIAYGGEELLQRLGIRLSC